MDFRRNGLRDERRRRVLIDETLHGNAESNASTSHATSDSSATPRTPVKSYSDAAMASSQTPVTVFLPKHPSITWGVWFTGLALIAGIGVLHQFVYLAAPVEIRNSLVAMDVAARGSLASWFSAVVLGVSGFAAFVVYQIRRHRMDDYRGRYRWWLRLVPLLFLLSVNASTSLHDVLSGVLTFLTGAQIAVGGKGWWLLAYAAVFLPIVPQLAIELWPSRLASFCFALTTAQYVFVALWKFGLVHVADPSAGLPCHLVLLSAHLGILVTILAYGRYVYLDAHGRLAPRQPWLRRSGSRRSRKDEVSGGKVESSARPSKPVRVDEGHTKFNQASSSPTVTLQPESDGVEVDPEEEDHKLSKAERRRLRKEAHRLARG